MKRWSALPRSAGVGSRQAHAMQPAGTCEREMDMTFDFGRLTAYAARARFLRGGTITRWGTVFNVDRSAGPCGLTERRMLDKIKDGRPRTRLLRFGDRARIETFDADGASFCGAIDQAVQRYEAE